MLSIIKKTSHWLRNNHSLLIKSLLFILLFQSFHLSTFGAPSDEILLDKTSKSLIAPEGEDFQWSLDQQKIDGATGKEIIVKKSGLYTVELMRGRERIKRNAYILMQAGTIIKVYLIGDSTVMTYGSSQYPFAGWGQILPFFFNSNVQIINKAIGGRSSKSFHVEGRWTPIKDALQAGDFVFIQFGHNDRDFSKPERYADTATYKSYLRIYVNDTRSKGGFPVLVTPMVMNAWNGTTMRNVFTEGANDYRGAMVDVANKLKVPLVDLNTKSHNLFKALGRDYITNYLYLTLQPGEYPNYPNGNTDGTHFQEMGAIELSKLIVLGLNELSSDVNVSKLLPNLKPTYQIATNSNNYTAGMMTRTNTYPIGLKVTLKVKPNAGFTFQKWTDEANNTSSMTRMFFHTMGTSSHTFNAAYSTAGTTGSTIQENTTGFCKVEGTVDSNNGGFTGTGFANTNNATAAGVVWKINVPASGSYTLTWNHSNGVNANRPGRILINGTTVISSLGFPYTGNWTTWDEVSTTLNLNSGANTIRLEATTSAGLSNIDYLKVIGNNPTKVSCTASARIVEDEEKRSSNTIQAYPNPFSGSVYLKSEGLFSFSITNVNGEVKEKGKGKDETTAGSNLKPGVYILKIASPQETREIKLIKQ